jgi:hypothetical protein
MPENILRKVYEFSGLCSSIYPSQLEIPSTTQAVLQVFYLRKREKLNQSKKSHQFNQILVSLVLEESINEYRHESYREC